jgi:type II restriction/modification system DNA methylase subunit YeeA
MQAIDSVGSVVRTIQRQAVRTSHPTVFLWYAFRHFSRLLRHPGVGNDPRYTPTTTSETFRFPAGLTPRYAGDNSGAIAASAIRLNELRENWLNPPEWVDWVITPEEEKAGFPKRPVAKPGHEAELKKRTLTNLYNARPAWLDMAHKQLDQTVAAAYGWTDYTPEMPDDEILRRLLALNLERAARPAAA